MTMLLEIMARGLARATSAGDHAAFGGVLSGAFLGLAALSVGSSPIAAARLSKRFACGWFPACPSCINANCDVFNGCEEEIGYCHGQYFSNCWNDGGTRCCDCYCGGASMCECSGSSA